LGSIHGSKLEVDGNKNEAEQPASLEGEYGTYKDQMVIVQQWSKLARLQLGKNEWMRLKAVKNNS